MSTRPATKNIACPFWCKQTKKCTVQQKGLFIPLEDHVDLYCTSNNYPNCLQYSHQVSGQLQFADETIHSFINRRRFVRIKLQRQVTLVRTSSTNDPTEVTNQAQTLDLSLGGMRLATEKPLHSDSVVQFSFDDETMPDHMLTGSGYIAWCNKQIDEPGYQAGIVFGEKQVSKEIGSYLNSIRNRL